MKFKVKCQSPLLQYSLEYYLKDFLSDDGVLITDDLSKEGIIIGKDIKKPFTKNSLLIQLQNISPQKQQKESLEEKLDNLFNKFKKELLEILKEHNAKK